MNDFNESINEPIEDQTIEPTVTETQEVDQPAETVTEEWTPDYTYKVYDEEREIPEDLRAIITSKEKEEYVKKLFSKADGLEPLKGKYEKAKAYATEKEQAYAEATGELENFRERFDALNYYAQNDLDAFHKAAGITDDKLFNYVAKKIALLEDPDKLSEHEKGSDVARQNYAMKKELDQLKYQSEEIRRNQEMNEYHSTMAKPDVKDFQSKFDSLLGEGSFQQHIAAHAKEIHYVQKKACSPQQAVDYVINTYSKIISKESVPETPKSTPQARSTQNLPKLGNGRGVIPAKTEISSLEDLKKRSDELRLQGL